ncbi:copper transport outer membrane protein MctB [Blastococcus colisei]|uniref:Copper transport outer membrane protein MctB n=1 Tax=Blastococcus colisei TaxID=1564162 RepID=A0A543PGF3_9ACTN|nr:copper transporter [Blastococcus colisei]TQN43153.1 copper transport outer membrane protein MctB [Blastococcus colisei]
MIDFRYHLVSLIAVFLAVALGIVIGTTALNEPILADIENQVADLEQDKRALEDQTQELQTQLDTADAFQEAVAPVLVDGTLTGRSVLLVTTNEDVAPEVVEEVRTLIAEAGGTINGELSLRPEYSDPSTSAALQNYVTDPGGLPAGIELPATDDTGELVGSLLAQTLMIPAEGAASDGAVVSSVLAGLASLDVLAVDSDGVSPADHAVVLTADAFTGEDGEARNETVIDLVTALDAAGSGAVVAGNAASAGETGLVGAIRADPSLAAAVSTVDNVATLPGQISTVLALGAESEGTSGVYGTGEGAQPVPPVPASAP